MIANPSRMRQRIGLLAHRFGVAIRLDWEDVSGVVRHPVTKEKLSGAAVPDNETVRGFMHEMEAKAVERLHTVIQEGDVIVDLPATVTIDGRTNLTFTIHERVYVQKEIPTDLQAVWTASYADTEMVRTLLLTPRP